jgi:general stress protein 26
MSKELSRDVLEQLVVAFLESEGMCVMATCRNDVPRASAVEFFPEGTTLYVMTEGGVKIENLKENPRVSVAVHTSFLAWDRIKGVQITGTAEIGQSGSEIFLAGERVYASSKGEFDMKLPELMNVIKITPLKIEYLDTTLQANGYDARHVLEY